MPIFLEPSRNAEQTRWLQEALDWQRDSWSLILPAHFDAYVRLYPTVEFEGRQVKWRHLLPELGHSWHEDIDGRELFDSVNEANRRKCDEGSLSLDTAVELAHCLGPVSSPKWYFAYWHGFGNLIKGIDQGCTFRLPAREYFLHEGGAECLALSAVTYPWYQSANMVWPADQSWCLAMEIDFFTAYIGCSRSIADLLLSNQRIECSLADSIQC
jgi:hypothetical protein